MASDTPCRLAAGPVWVTVSPARRPLTVTRYSLMTSRVEPEPIPKVRLPEGL